MSQYIPPWLNPGGRQWIAGERVELRTPAVSISVGIVLSNGRARFSAGWNEFVKSNDLNMNDTLNLNLIEEGQNWVFLVEVTH